MRTHCRKCSRADVPLTPVGYCYLCFSRFGSASQVAMLLMAYNPSLSVDLLQQCLGWGQEDQALARYIWHQVRIRLEEEARFR